MDVIETENIQLDQFLKWEGIVETGGQVKLLIEDKMIYVNEKLETAEQSVKMLQLQPDGSVGLTDFGRTED